MFVFIESAVFDRIRPSYLDDDEYGDLQQYMIRNPEAGAVVPGPAESGSFVGGAKALASAADCA